MVVGIHFQRCAVYAASVAADHPFLTSKVHRGDVINSCHFGLCFVIYEKNLETGVDFLKSFFLLALVAVRMDHSARCSLSQTSFFAFLRKQYTVEGFCQSGIYRILRVPAHPNRCSSLFAEHIHTGKCSPVIEVRRVPLFALSPGMTKL